MEAEFFCQRDVRDPIGCSKKIGAPIHRCKEQCTECEGDVDIANASTEPSEFLEAA